MSGSSKPSLLPAPVPRAMSYILERKPPPSPLPEHVRAPPPSPVSAPKLETDNDVHSETTHDPHAVDSWERSSPISTTSNRRKSRKNEKHPSRHSPLSKLFKPTLVLENSGSVARDHLASERTFLAYVRTSLLLATTGVGLVQLFAVASTSTASPTLRQIRRFARPIGATLVVIGLFILTVGVRRYFVIQAFLTKGLFPVTRFAIAGITIMVAIMVIIIFGVLVSART